MSDPTPLGLAHDLILALMRGPLEMTPTQAALAVIRRELRFALGTEDRPGKWEKLHDLLLNLSDPCALPQGDTPMSTPPTPPQFHVGDFITVHLPDGGSAGRYHGQSGVVQEVLEVASSALRRYVVEMADGERLSLAAPEMRFCGRDEVGEFSDAHYDALLARAKTAELEFNLTAARQERDCEQQMADLQRRRSGVLEQQLREAHDFVEAVKKERDEARQQLDNVAQAYGFLLDEHRTLSNLLSGAFAPSDAPATLRERVERVVADLETLRQRQVVVTTAPFEGYAHPDGFREGDPALNTATNCLRNLTGLLRELQRDGLGPRYGLGAARIRAEKAISALEDYQRRAGLIGRLEANRDQRPRTTVTIHAVGGREEVTKQVLTALERTFAQQAGEPRRKC